MTITANLRSVSVALGASLGLCLAQSVAAGTADNPFRSPGGSGDAVQVAQGKCGEGKCGAGMMKRRGGKCGMQRMDSDGDGKVTRDEFMKGHEDMFELIDKNGDGVIDSSERDAHRQMMRNRKGRCGMGKCGQGGGE